MIELDLPPVDTSASKPVESWAGKLVPVENPKERAMKLISVLERELGAIPLRVKDPILFHDLLEKQRLGLLSFVERDLLDDLCRGASVET